MLRNDNWPREADYYAKLKIQCKNCGRKRVFPYFKNKMICDWCGQVIYRSKRIEFEDNLRKELRRCT